MNLDLQHFKNSYFLFFSGLFLLHQILEKILSFHIQWVDSYLDNLLFMPIFLHFILWEKRFLFQKGIQYRIPVYEVLIWWLFISILVEYFFPLWNAAFTRDIWDVFCYGLGAAFFLLFMNQEQNRMRK